MRPVVFSARALIRQAAGQRTLYLVRRPMQIEPEVTLDIPCGQTRAVTLGRWPLDALPTDDELAHDIRGALAALNRTRQQKPAHSVRSQASRQMGHAL